MDSDNLLKASKELLQAIDKIIVPSKYKSGAMVILCNKVEKLKEVIKELENETNESVGLAKRS